MVIQTETYPGYNYKVEQTYTTVNDGYCSPNNLYTMKTTTNAAQLIPSGGYTHNHHDGSHEKFNGGHGIHKGSHGSHQGAYGHLDVNKHQTDHYNHGSNGKKSSLNKLSNIFKPSSVQCHQAAPNGGYGTHHGSHQGPYGSPNHKVESMKYEYVSSDNGGIRCPTTNAHQGHHSNGGLQSGYQKVMWEVKALED